MPDTGKAGQLTFDFDDFSDHDRSPGSNTREMKSRDDMIPGLFDPVVSEEEEMKEFLRKIHSAESPAGEPEQNDSAPDFPFDHPADSAGLPHFSSSEKSPGKKQSLTRKQLQRAALAFLASLEPSGLAADVPVYGSRGKASAAAFRLESGKVLWTAIAEIRTEADALVETAGNAEQIHMLKLARMEREMLEQEIRRTEPGLRDSAMLFSEFEHWNYKAADNPAYQECMRKIRHLEHSVFHGSRMERFQAACAASDLYLIVPEQAVRPDIPAAGWGVVCIKSDLSFELVKQPERNLNIPAEKLTGLSLNIAGANVSEVLFANGIHKNVSGKFHCGRLPRRRRN